MVQTPGAFMSCKEFCSGKSHIITLNHHYIVTKNSGNNAVRNSVLRFFPVRYFEYLKQNEKKITGTSIFSKKGKYRYNYTVFTDKPEYLSPIIYNQP